MGTEPYVLLRKKVPRDIILNSNHEEHFFKHFDEIEKKFQKSVKNVILAFFDVVMLMGAIWDGHNRLNNVT